MTLSVQVATYGRPAGVALSDVIREAKRNRALAPVTVIVGSHFAGLAARRLLGSGRLTPPGERAGIANVSFVTPHRLAELVAPDQLLDRRPLTNPVLGAAVRMMLRDEPGRFMAVADHHATELALADLYGELDQVSATALERLAAAGGSAGASAATTYNAVASRVEAFYGDADVARVATAVTDLSVRVAAFGQLIWYLPEPTTAPIGAFLHRVFEVADATAIVGCSGDAEADAPVWRSIASAGGSRPAEQNLREAPTTADEIVSVTDPDEEVRVVIRRVLALTEQGVPLDRIGVFFPSNDPYVGLLEHHLRASDLPANGPSRRHLADSVAGRAIATALALPAEGWRRDRVMALVSTVPVRHATVTVRPSAWDRASRSAGVVKGLPDWQRKVEFAIENLTDRQSSVDAEERPWLIERLDREMGDLRDLRAFVEDLDASVSAVADASTWPTKSQAARALLHDLLGAGGTHHGWPEDEQAMFEQVETALVRLAGLDEIEPVASHATFLAALSTELEVRSGRTGRFGQGMTYGPLASASGLDLDAVFILGCAEGRLPAARSEDTLLRDDVRSLAGGELELRSDRLHHQHRHFLAALETAPEGRRVLTYPRGDLRNGRQMLPSRWLLDTASALAGRTIYSTDFDDLDGSAGIVEFAPSHAGALIDTAMHLSVEERDLALVARHTGRSQRPLDHPLAGLAARGILMQEARRSNALTEFDGNLAGCDIPKTGEQPQSPTRLQNWATCGFRYFLGSVLGLSDREDPESIIELSPLERGSVVHRALELFIGEAIANGTVPRPDQPWSPEQRDRLRVLAEAEFAELERRGVVGRELHWQVDRLNLFSLLDDFLDADDKHRADTKSTPVTVELPFGLQGAPPVVITLDDGRKLHFRGYADRVDSGEGGVFHVSDYKTGRGDKYKVFKKDDADPTQAGEMLQLGLYAEAAAQLLDAEEADARYWVVDTRAGYARFGYPWTPARKGRFTDVLEAIVDGIEGGVFAARPGERKSFGDTFENCTYCDFDTVCSSNRVKEAEAKADAPEHEVRLKLENARMDIVDAFLGKETAS